MFKKRQENDYEPVLARHSVIGYPGAGELTWTCHVCGEERPDRYISVFSRERILEAGVRVRMNVRYCNDRPECREQAPTVDFGLN